MKYPTFKYFRKNFSIRFEKHQVGQTKNVCDSLVRDLGCQGSSVRPNVFNIYCWRKFDIAIQSSKASFSIFKVDTIMLALENDENAIRKGKWKHFVIAKFM